MLPLAYRCRSACWMPLEVAEMKIASGAVSAGGRAADGARCVRGDRAVTSRALCDPGHVDPAGEVFVAGRIDDLA